MHAGLTSLRLRLELNFVSKLLRNESHEYVEESTDNTAIATIFKQNFRDENSDFQNSISCLLRVDSPNRYISIFSGSALKSTNLASKFSCSLHQKHLIIFQINPLQLSGIHFL
jgi:hypothetical protein